MNPPINPPSTLHTLTSELASSLKERSQSTLSNIIGRNQTTKYFDESPLLSSVRAAKFFLAEQTLVLDAFYELVPLSTYAAYQPFVSCLLTLSSPITLAPLQTLPPMYPTSSPQDSPNSLPIRQVPQVTHSSISQNTNTSSTNPLPRSLRLNSL